ncbi:putative methyltransferase-like protein 24 [Menidia menidia]
MWRERLTLRLLLRLGILLTGLAVCLHVYLETGWQDARGPLSLGPPIQSNQNPGQQNRMSTEPEEQNKDVRKKMSHVSSHILRRDSHRHRKTPRWRIDLQPWASENQSLEEEARRFLNYITTPQVTCASTAGNGSSLDRSNSQWVVCLDPKYSLVHRMQRKHCRVYSFGLGPNERFLEHFLAASGCEVHCFDPSLKEPHRQEAEMWHHRLSVDWRDPNPAFSAQRQHATTKKLATILNEFGHRELDVLKADMESAEWKILENLVLEGVLDTVGQLLLEIHLHWAGFEVGGDDPAVVRYWFSLLKELERAKFHLFHIHSDPMKPHLFLHKNVLNASSVYTLSWVNTQWNPARMLDKPKK